ncbi:MAG: hypothetical protein M1820_004323 [Bogoriella megaspora]|nr:MAG: hypothetical protein M1820_004323 [Bogoriella megaspora]
MASVRSGQPSVLLFSFCIVTLLAYYFSQQALSFPLLEDSDAALNVINTISTNINQPSLGSAIPTLLGNDSKDFVKRDISDKDWDAFKCKGEILLSQMASDTPASQWTEYSQLDDFGWTHDDAEPKILKDYSDAVSGLDMSTDADDWVFVKGTQSNGYNVDGEDFPATNAYYELSINPSSGCIAFENTKSPTAMATNKKGKKTKPVAEAAKMLGQMSDLGFLEYQHAAQSKNAPLDNLKYILRMTIYNLNTIDIFKRALGAQGHDYADLGSFADGSITIQMSTDEGKAILGSPNGRAGAFILAQHQQAFGKRKTINSVRIWNEIGLPSVMFNVVDV